MSNELQKQIDKLENTELDPNFEEGSVGGPGISAEDLNQDVTKDGMDIDTALVLYRNLQGTIFSEVEALIAPHTKTGKRKNTNTRMYDLITVANVFKVLVRDMDINTKQFEEDGVVVNAKALSLYSQSMAVMKAKEVIKNDIKAQLASGSVEGVSEELKQKVLKEL